MISEKCAHLLSHLGICSNAFWKIRPEVIWFGGKSIHPMHYRLRIRVCCITQHRQTWVNWNSIYYQVNTLFRHQRKWEYWLLLSHLTGLCYHDTLLHDFHIFIASLGPTFGLKSFTEIISDADSPSTIMLLLYCDLMTHYVTWVIECPKTNIHNKNYPFSAICMSSILDDIEMYEQQAPFELTDFVVLSNFINVLLYKTIHGHLIGISS